jgi:hypothetical protein
MASFHGTEALRDLPPIPPLKTKAVIQGPKRNARYVPFAAVNTLLQGDFCNDSEEYITFYLYSFNLTKLFTQISIW